MTSPRTAGRQERKERRRQVADLYVQAVSLVEMAESLGVDAAAVKRDLKAVHAAWRRERPDDLDTLRERELQKIDRVEREAWRAWERSQRDVVATKLSHDEKSRKAERTSKEQFGDPRYLTMIKDCIDRRCRLLGLGTETSSDQPPAPVCEVVVATHQQAAAMLTFEQFQQAQEPAGE
ncbi:hypothetical protein [Lignipirellula cremea]|uniref:Uncharacterized protein n=1 Tax=Lignipirellula cremea TaxID=2528010 RepID=A0A518E097_9BACT|nr:hypothetical protein [Lignipirellula cremea]QDU97520.1 hypothetical protein Pla8534_53680 [Lignipirellula cremea]